MPTNISGHVMRTVALGGECQAITGSEYHLTPFIARMSQVEYVFRAPQTSEMFGWRAVIAGLVSRSSGG